MSPDICSRATLVASRGLHMSKPKITLARTNALKRRIEETTQAANDLAIALYDCLTIQELLNEARAEAGAPAIKSKPAKRVRK